MFKHEITIVVNSHIQQLIEPTNKKWENQYLTANEWRMSELSGNYIQYIAGRFAAKKAARKILGIKSCSPSHWLDIEILRLSTGQPIVLLSGKCQQIAVDMGLKNWLVSISHVQTYAVASAIAHTGYGTC
ncbi:MAG: holo-ACP synthase [Nodularia sp. (in: Bacteria)]|nr:MAG: holo-ACP synthase [Nodularia sp. (in: cyanobacteria)]